MDSKKKYDQMVEDGDIVPAYAKELYELSKLPPPIPRPTIAKYIWVLDFEDGKVYRYNISALLMKNQVPEHLWWNPDSESCEEFLTDSGHNLTNCEWMVTSEREITNKNFINYKSNVNTNKN